MVKDDLQFVIDCLPLEELLSQLAEEGAELAQAALKLRRCYDGSNPARISKEEAMKQLQEEVADVMLALDALGMGDSEHLKIYAEIMERKVQRWAKSLEGDGG